MSEKSNHEVRQSYPKRYREQFGINLKKRMKEQHVTQAKLAEEMGVSRTCVGFWCHGRTIPSNARLKELALFLETSPMRLLGYSLDSTKSDETWMTAIVGNNL